MLEEISDTYAGEIFNTKNLHFYESKWTEKFPYFFPDRPVFVRTENKKDIKKMNKETLILVAAVALAITGLTTLYEAPSDNIRVNK